MSLLRWVGKKLNPVERVGAVFDACVERFIDNHKLVGKAEPTIVDGKIAGMAFEIDLVRKPDAKRAKIDLDEVAEAD